MMDHINMKRKVEGNQGRLPEKQQTEISTLPSSTEITELAALKRKSEALKKRVRESLAKREAEAKRKRPN